MSPRRFLALAALLALPAAASAQQFRYSPATTQYRLAVTGSGYAEQGPQRQDLNFETSQRYTVALAAGGRDTLAFTMTLDSLSGRAANGQPVNDAEIRGLKVSGRMAPNGRVLVRDSVATANPMFAQVVDEMVRFLPVIPAGVRVGMSWTDTIATPITQMGIQLQRTVVTTYRVAGATTFDGERSWQLVRDSKTSISGQGAVMGQAVTVDGTATGGGMLYVSRSGHFLGGNTTDDVKTTVVVLAQGVEVNNVQNLKTAIARVR